MGILARRPAAHMLRLRPATRIVRGDRFENRFFGGGNPAMQRVLVVRRALFVFNWAVILLLAGCGAACAQQPGGSPSPPPASAPAEAPAATPADAPAAETPPAADPDPAPEPAATAPAANSPAAGATANVPPASAPTNTAPAVDSRRAFFALGVGIVTVLGLIIVAKTNAFLALITAAILVSLLAPGDVAIKITRVAEAFGRSAGSIGIVIALAAVIGKCMLDSGAADRIVRAFVRLFGERQASVALVGSGFVLAVPVFFDTVFYLLVPLARSLHRRTGKAYLQYILAIAAGGAITHTLVPPTPGPLTMASNLKFDVGLMILVGLMVAAPAAIAGLVFAFVADRLMPTPMRQIGSEPEPEPLSDHELPPLWESLLPVILPVILISGNTIVQAILAGYKAPPGSETVIEIPAWLAMANGTMSILGNANMALLLSTVIALATVYRQRDLSLKELGIVMETSLMSGGVIILITAAGGAFGAMLGEAKVGDAIRLAFADKAASGLGLILLGFGVAALFKVAQGSSTVAMITTSGMLAPVVAAGQAGFHPVYLATAIGAGSLVGSWMNDSGFWIFAKMGGLTEIEALKSWTILLLVLAFVSLAMTCLLVTVWPYPLGLK
jgi:gluconate:H+ symporter, GntP family